MRIRNLIVLSSAVLFATAASAQSYILTGTSYSQSFDTLINTGSAQVWGNDSTLDGWSLFNRSSAAIAAYSAADGGSNAGSFNSFGTGTNTDRALGGTASGGAYFGSPATGALAGYIAFGATNSSGQDFTSFTIGYDGEQWRNGGNTSAQTMVLEYGFGATFGDVSSWTAAGSGFNFTSPVVGSTSAAVNGNVAGLVSGLGGTLAVAWNQNTTLWVRWIENNDAGNDHGLAVDNFTLNAAATAIPEPSTYAAIFGGLALVGAIVHRRRSRQVSAV